MKNHSLKFGIKTKLSLLTILTILFTLAITLFISSTREIQFKKDEVKKLMINIGKQIGIMKGLTQPIPYPLFSEYLRKTVYSSLSRKSFSISMVYIITTDAVGNPDIPVFNWQIIQAPKHDANLLAKKIIQGQYQARGIQQVMIELAGKGRLYLGFSLQILKSEILVGLFEHMLIGLLLIALGILAAKSIANKITRPLFKIIEGFQKVSKGNFDSRVEVGTSDELDELAQSFNQMTEGLKERELIKDSFRRYATDQVVQKILEGQVRPTLSGELRDITVLFSDIRMFTALASKLQPTDVVHVLNKYFTAMTEVALKNEGLIDKFTGDEMMVVFGAPIPQTDHSERAIRTALGMLKRLEDVNAELEKENYPRIDIGIGINTGVAVAGNVGSEKRMAYTVIGQDVNLAARLVAIAQKGEIVLSSATYDKVKGLIEAKPETVSLKGLDQPSLIYRTRPV